MKNFLIVSLLSIFISNVALASNITKTGIPLDSLWKQKVYEYAQKNVNHSAWGIAHSERDYQLSLELAKQEQIKIDKDVIFAAAFFHDIGAIDSFRKKNVEHSIRSVEIAEPLLKSYGFPMQKWPKVKSAILGHMYYAEKPVETDAIIFHDADALDFFGTIGIVRLVSITERHKWSENLAGAFATLQQFKIEVTNALLTNSAKEIARLRISEMDQVITLLDQETFTGKAL